jgi:hypothetical protein
MASDQCHVFEWPPGTLHPERDLVHGYKFAVALSELDGFEHGGASASELDLKA